MMTNLFSIFDPATPLFFSLNWISALLFLVIMSPMLWTGNSPSTNLIKNLKTYIYSEFSPILNHHSFNLTLMLSIFMFIILNNLMGLAPYIFTATAHMSVSLSLALPLWFGLMYFSLSNNLSNTLAHLIPQGTPIILMPFMVIIETISNLIRPGTLAIRLAANMIAGHLLISLISDAFNNCPLFLTPILLSAQIALNILELAVAFIQGYVFSVLATLYLAESCS